MASKKTSMFTLTERLTMTSASETFATIDLGSYVDVGDRQALQVHSVDFIFQGATATSGVTASLGATGFIQVQVTDLNRGGIVFADDRALVSSAILNYDTDGQSSVKGDLLLEPFAGTASFCAAAKFLGRNFIGFEQDKDYQKLANKRLKSIQPLHEELVEISDKDKPQKKIPFGTLINSGYLEPGSSLYNKNKSCKAKILPDGSLTFGSDRGSIHKIAAKINNTSTFNGWDYWHYEDSKKELVSINEIRKKIRN